MTDLKFLKNHASGSYVALELENAPDGHAVVHAGLVADADDVGDAAHALLRVEGIHHVDVIAHENLREVFFLKKRGPGRNFAPMIPDLKCTLVF
jgi:hypothetical protein